MTAFRRDESKRSLLFIGISAAALAVSFFVAGRLPVDAAWAAILLCGIPILKDAVTGLVTRFDIKADVLVSIALVAAVAIGEIFAAGEVAFIMAIGAWLEERTVAKARAGIEKLVRLTPATARVIRGGQEVVVPAAEVEPGDTLRVFAGETIAADGVITAGQTSVDQSVMTGEPMPADKGPGDEVRSGTVNQFGTFDMAAEKAKESGCTVIFLSLEGDAAGMLALSDTLRDDARDAVQGIHSAGFKTVLLTGDGPGAAAQMAEATGIDDVRAGCLPEDKLEIIREYQAKGEAVCMVGDGINDAPALRAAQVGVAMGGIGSDIAIEAADIALVGDDIRVLPNLLLAKKTMRTIRVNLAASMILNLPPWPSPLRAPCIPLPGRWCTTRAQWRLSSIRPCC